MAIKEGEPKNLGVMMIDSNLVEVKRVIICN